MRYEQAETANRRELNLYQEITLTRGMVSVVDESDFGPLGFFNWRVQACSGKFYAAMTGADGKVVLLHRFLMNAPRGFDVDHINGDGLDNRRSNLRVCTHAENLRNRKVQKNARLGLKGIYQDGRSGKWRARLCFKGRHMYLGKALDTPEEAARVYDAAARIHYGKFAVLNFP